MFEWVEKPLGQLADFVMGQSPDSSAVSELPGGLPFLQGCAEFGPRSPEPKYYVAPALRIAPKNSTLISVRAPVGTMNDANQSYGIGRGLAAVVGRGYSNQFLRYAIQLNTSWLHRRSQGSTFLAIGSDDLHKLPIKVTDDAKICEAAAKVIALIDTQIEATEGVIAKQERVRAGLMQDLFTRGVDEHGQLRPPRHQAPHVYHQTELGWLPVGWDVGPITKCLNSPSDATIGPFGSNLVATDYRNAGVPVIFVRDVKPERFIWKSDVFVDSAKAKSLAAHGSQPGDVIATKMGFPPCIACVHPKDFPAAIITADMIRLRVSRRDVAIPEFVAGALNSELVLSQVRAITGGVTRPKITLADFRSLQLAFPPVEEQKLIFGRMRLIDGLIDDHLRELAKLALQKLGLMQDLLTGTVSVAPLLESGVLEGVGV